VSGQQVADMTREVLPSTQHLRVNGYANAWLIAPSDMRNRSTFTIVLDYVPQHRVLVGFGITLLGLGFALLLAAFQIARPWMPSRSLGHTLRLPTRLAQVRHLGTRTWR